MLFPKEWNQVFDDLVPALVKSRFSPKEQWKDKPFSDLDARFFSRGIIELSDRFTTEREDDGGGQRRTRLGPYFSQAKYRSSYLLYFLPFQAAKFLALFQMHPDALEPFLAVSSTGPLKVLDVGSGPGTASIALILELLRRAGPTRFPKIELTWLDSNREILEDGKAILEKIFEKIPSIRDKVKLETVAGDWLSGLRPSGAPYSLILLGNVLNELSGTELQSEKRFNLLADLFRSARGAGTLIIEPAEKSASQVLGRLRDRLFGDGVFTAKPSSLWGPCLHAGTCPLSNAKDWCHFSVPAQIPGKWFAKFSLALGSERDWLKFSYLWLTSEEHPNKDERPDFRRVVSDALRERDGHHTLLLCEPDQTFRMRADPRQKLHRGDLVKKP